MSCEGCQVQDLCEDKGRFRMGRPRCYVNLDVPVTKSGKYDHGVGTSAGDVVYAYETGAQKGVSAFVTSIFGKNRQPPPEKVGNTVRYKDNRGRTVTIRRDEDLPSTIVPLAGSIDLSSKIKQPDGTVKREKRHFGFVLKS